MAQAAWLVDMAYVVKAAKKDRMKIDYVSARRLLAERYGSVSCFLFNSFDDALGVPPGLDAFYKAMEAQGMIVCLHPMSGDTAEGTHRQRRVDVDIACHAVSQAASGTVDPIILTTGDQDLIPAVVMSREQFRVSVVLFTFGHSVSHELSAAASDHLLFENFRAQIER